MVRIETDVGITLIVGQDHDYVRRIARVGSGRGAELRGVGVAARIHRWIGLIVERPVADYRVDRELDRVHVKRPQPPTRFEDPSVAEEIARLEASVSRPR